MVNFSKTDLPAIGFALRRGGRVQIRYMPGRSLFSGIGPVYSFESLEGEDSNRSKGTGSLFLLRAIRIPMADLSKRLDMTLAAVSYAVKRGEKIAKEAGCHLDD